MEKISGFLKELKKGYTYYEAENLNDYLTNSEKIKVGREGFIAIVYGQYELILDKNTEFNLNPIAQNGFNFTYQKKGENSILEVNRVPYPMPEYILLNPFLKNSLEVRINPLKLINIVPNFLIYPDKKLITPIFDPILIYEKNIDMLFVGSYDTKRTIQRKRKEKEETKPLLERLVPQYLS